MPRNTYYEDEELEHISKHTLWRLLSYLSPYKARISIAFVLIIISAVASLLGPFLVKIAIDEYMPNGDIAGIIGLALLYIGFLFVNAICIRYRILIMVRMGNQVIADIRRETFSHVQDLSFRFFDLRPAGKIMVRIMHNTDRMQQLVKHGFITIMADLFRLLIIFAFMFTISIRLSLISLAITPLLAIVIFILKTKIRQRWQLYQKKNSNLNAYAHESFTGIKETQSFVREERNSQIMREQLGENYSSWMSAVRLSNLLFPIVLLFNTFSIALVYILGFRFLGFGLVSLGTLIAFGQYIWMITEPVVNLSNFYNEILVSLSAAERVFDLLDTEATVVDKEGAYPLPEIQGRVKFQDVNFSYEEGIPIFSRLNMEVEPGETVALVGETGAGKSTIINLIGRFYDIQSGEIRIDGHEIRDVTIKSLRSQVGVMMQDPFIFSGSVFENILYGRLDASPDEVIQAAKDVHAHGFIMQMEEGYDTKLAERGSRLSVGQKQLVAFARTLLFDPKILILDEATASIDTQTELLLQQAIAKVLKGRTSFVIAHRLSTIRNADHIVVIDAGRIIEYGNHEELLKKRGKYYELHEAQYKKVV